MKIGARLRLYHGVIFEFMRKHDLTSRDMAYLCEISYATFNNIYGLKSRASQRTAELIATVIECDPEDIKAGFVSKDIPRVVETVKEYEPRAIEDWAERYRARAIRFDQPDVTCEDKEELKVLTDCLHERSREIIEDVFMKNMSYAEIGRKFDLCRERVRGIVDSALRKMRKFATERDARFKLESAGFTAIREST